jgi:DNA-binding transcriptional ArsR family regulator
MEDELDAVWKALADRTRRQLLDLLRDGPHTTGDLCARFEMSRFGVMKHLGVLEEAGLLTVRREGRERWNYLNAVPLRRIYERWVSKYAEFWSASLLSLKDTVEEES